MKIGLLYFVLFSGNCHSQELSDSTSISRIEAIEIAEKEGCYPKGINWTISIDYVKNYTHERPFGSFILTEIASGSQTTNQKLFGLMRNQAL